MSPKKGLFNRKYIFQPSFFRGYVSFQGGRSQECYECNVYHFKHTSGHTGQTFHSSPQEFSHRFQTTTFFMEKMTGLHGGDRHGKPVVS